MSVCPSILAYGARTAGRIGTDKYSFDAKERLKNDGNGFELIGFMWHVPRAIAQTPAKKVAAKGAGQTNGRIRLILGGLIANMSGLNPLG